MKVPLGSYDSDESIEVNIDIDWPRKSEDKHIKPKGPKDDGIVELPEGEETDREKKVLLTSPIGSPNSQPPTSRNDAILH